MIIKGEVSLQGMFNNKLVSGFLTNISFYTSKETEAKKLFEEYVYAGGKEKFITALLVVTVVDWSTLFDLKRTWVPNTDTGSKDWAPFVDVRTLKQYRAAVTGAAYLTEKLPLTKDELDRAAWLQLPDSKSILLSALGGTPLGTLINLTPSLGGFLLPVKLPYDSSGTIEVIIQERINTEVVQSLTGFTIQAMDEKSWTDWGKETATHISFHYDTHVPRLSNLKLEVAKKVDPATGEEIHNPLHDSDDINICDTYYYYTYNDDTNKFEKVTRANLQGALLSYIKHLGVNLKLTGQVDGADAVLFMVNKETGIPAYRNLIDDFNMGLSRLFSNSSFLSNGDSFELYRRGTISPNIRLDEILDEIVKGFLDLPNINVPIVDKFGNNLTLEALINEIRSELNLIGLYEVHVHRPEKIITENDLFLESLIGSSTYVHCNTVVPNLEAVTRPACIVDGTQCEIKVHIANLYTNWLQLHTTPIDSKHTIETGQTVDVSYNLVQQEDIASQFWTKLLENNPIYGWVTNHVSVLDKPSKYVTIPQKYASDTNYHEDEGWAIYIKDMQREEAKFEFLENVKLTFDKTGENVTLKFTLPQVSRDYAIQVRALNIENGLVGELYLFLQGNGTLISYPTVHTKGAIDLYDKNKGDFLPTTPYMFKTINGKGGWHQVIPYVGVPNDNYNPNIPESSDNPKCIWKMTD